jgi:hypothetical protein
MRLRYGCVGASQWLTVVASQIAITMAYYCCIPSLIFMRMWNCGQFTPHRALKWRILNNIIEI